jgi:hypothetical protein
MGIGALLLLTMIGLMVRGLFSNNESHQKDAKEAAGSCLFLASAFIGGLLLVLLVIVAAG